MTVTASADPFVAARAVADAVLYEGYVLYPYRASAAKNQVRWQFGVLAPESMAKAAGERSRCRTECLLRPVPPARDGAPGPAMLDVRVRFLQVETRQVEASTDGGFTPVASLDTGGTIHTTFEGGIEHEADVLVEIDEGAGCGDLHLTVPPTTDVEPIIGSDGRLAGRIVSERRSLEATLRVAVEKAGDSEVSVVRVDVVNTTLWDGEATPDRPVLVRRALIGVHTLLAARGASFVSLLDPPPGAELPAASCVSEGTYPVLVGPLGEEVVLSSPIILPEHPEVAPESAGEFCDATEIDEILALRILTLTDDEKRQARGTDPRAAAIVDRCDGLPEEVFTRLHGAIRSLRPESPAEPTLAYPGDPGATETFPLLSTPVGAEDDRPWWDPAVDGLVDPWTDTIAVEGVTIGKGSKVQLRPRRGADAQDLFLAGMAATVQGVFNDVDGSTHVAVTVDSDPGADLSIWHGRFLYFHPDEVEPLDWAQ